MKRKNFRAFMALLLVLSCLFSFTGCRHSSTLEQVVHTMKQPEEIDEEAEAVENEEDNTEEDESLASKEEDDESETGRGTEEEAPTEGEEPETIEEVPDTVFDNQSVNENLTSSPDGAEGNNLPAEAPIETEAPAESAPPEEIENPEGEGEGIVEEPNLTPSFDVSLRTIVDGKGREVQIPEEVNTVSVVGEAAIFVQMLAGPGSICASSGSFTGNSDVLNTFSDEGAADIPSLWYGDGSYAMSDESFQRLLEIRPDACFVTSGSMTFSDQQLQQLSEAKIYTLTLPKLNNASNIKRCARLIGEVFGDKTAEGGFDVPANAEKYCSWYDGIISSVSSKVTRFNYNSIDFNNDRYQTRQDVTIEGGADSGFYTLLVTGWDADAQYKLYSDTTITRDFQGVAVAATGYSTSPVSYYMSLAGVINTPATLADQFRLRHWYVDPLNPSTRISEITGNLGVQDEQRMTSITDVNLGTVYLGNASFPYVIAASEYIRQGILNDAASDRIWTNYGEMSSPDGSTHGTGFPDENGQIVSSDVHGDFSVVVNPCGVGSWVNGSAEGVMEAMWIARLYYNAFTDEEIIAEIQSFYSEFYRCDISEGAAAQILAGK